jgi:hypothetical protein
MTFWVYWHVKSLTCFNVHIYALSIYYKILFIILLLYIRHSFFGEGKGETQCLVLFPYLLPNIALPHLSIFYISFIFSFLLLHLSFYLCFTFFLQYLCFAFVLLFRIRGLIPFPQRGKECNDPKLLLNRLR